MPVFNVGCLQPGTVDKETGCYRPSPGCDSNGSFEDCRQNYYLKQQNEILRQGTQQQVLNSDDNDQKIQDLESRNADLQKLFEQQNQLNTQLVQSSERTTHKIENLNLINTILITILAVFFCIFLAVKIIKRKNHTK